MHYHDEPLCFRTAERLGEYDVVRFDDNGPNEMVRRITRVDGGHLVRTTGNLWHVADRHLVRVVASGVAWVFA